MEFETFSLNNRNEVEQFDKLLSYYMNQRCQLALSHISLVEIYDALQSREDGGRVFTSLMDIYINFILLYCDSHAVGSTWNQFFSKGKLEGGTVLDSKDKFLGKMNIHRFNTSFILRYRALWDKLMGFLILFYSPDDYDKFCKSKSKKKSFKNLSQEIDKITDELQSSISEMLTKFDNTFRTAEAHGTGVLRKYSFTMESMDKNPQIELVGFWNMVNTFITNIGGLFKPTNIDVGI